MIVWTGLLGDIAIVLVAGVLLGAVAARYLRK
jgi:hypothetical protein